MLEERLVNFGWRNLFTTTIDDFLQPIGDTKVTVPVKKSLVSSSEPAVQKSLVTARRLVQITGHELRTANDDLADFSLWQRAAGSVDDGYLRPRGQPHRASLTRSRRQRVAADGIALGHSVAFDDRRSEEFF